MARTTRQSISFYSYLGLFLVISLVFGIGGWAALAKIQGAVIASATVVVEGYSKKVQHTEGGRVAEIYVKEGDVVEAGQLLLRLDETEIKANLGIIETRLFESQAQQARLLAERYQAKELEFPNELLKKGKRLQKILQGQRKLFRARRNVDEGRREQLLLKIEQFEKEVEGLEAQKVAAKKETKFVKKELDVQLQLLKKGLARMDKLTALQSQAARLEGAIGQHTASIARVRRKITETRLNIHQIGQDRADKAETELQDVRTKISEYKERQVATITKLQRTKIRAPNSGFVHQLTAHTVGGVVPPREPIMFIVPRKAALELEARVEQHMRDRIKVGQDAIIRFSAFDQRTTPELKGSVVRIGADLTSTNANQPPYYKISIKLKKGELKKLGDKKLKPGMPAEAFLQTGSRTALNYMVKPLWDYIRKMFQER